MKKNICTLLGDGIGPEVINAAKCVLNAVGEMNGCEFNFVDAPIGGEAIDRFCTPLPEETLKIAKASDAVLLGAVGGPKWDHCTLRPESALLGLRKALGLYANLRPAKLYPSLTKYSALKGEITIKGIDLIIVRELTGGIYFGERGFRKNQKFGREAFDTECYSEIEIERVARVAYELALKRRRKLCLVDKANVLASSTLWRKVVMEINEDYPTVSVEMMYVDNAAMQLVLNPSQFDVIVTSNLFGDILSDLSAALIGSIGIIPSASLGSTTQGLYEAIHGSAPLLAGLNTANPTGTILSAAMMLRLSFEMNKEAAQVENAVLRTFEDGLGTADLKGNLSTTEFAQAIIDRL